VKKTKNDKVKKEIKTQKSDQKPSAGGKNSIPKVASQTQENSNVPT
jgi:hypothetical protein